MNPAGGRCDRARSIRTPRAGSAPVFSFSSEARPRTNDCSPSIRSAPASACCPAEKHSRTVWTRPPTRSRASTTVTAAPAASRSRAADSPASPAPATITRLPESSRAPSSAHKIRAAMLTLPLAAVLTSQLIDPGPPKADATDAGLETRLRQTSRRAAPRWRSRIARSTAATGVLIDAGQALPRRQHDEGAGHDRAVPAGAGRRALARRTARRSATSSAASWTAARTR